MAQKVIVAYIPVIHQGYVQLFGSNPAYHHALYVLGDELVNQDRALERDIRRLAPRAAIQALRAWNRFDQIIEASAATLQNIPADTEVLMPDEDISRTIAEQYFAHHDVTFYPIFLRWDRRASQKNLQVDPDITVTQDQAAQMLVQQAQIAGFESQDIWRRVGALLVKDGRVVAQAANVSRPSPHSSWINGDPRNNHQQGEGIEMSTFQHAESCLISDAARQGIVTADADIYINTFPCPQCAMLIAYAGVARLFFAEGYAALEGLNTLRTKNVQIIKVVADMPQDNPATFVPYPER